MTRLVSISTKACEQLKVLPISILTKVPIEVEFLRTYAYFEVIDVVNDTNPYPALLGIYWEIDN